MAAHPRRPGHPAPRRAVGMLAAVVLTVGACTSVDEPPTATPRPSNSATAAGTDASAAPATLPALHPSVDDWPAGRVEVVADDGTVHTVAVRIARTPEQRRHGLMEVPELPRGVGMWFVYDEEVSGGFWMKDTLVALDIAYVGADGRVVSIAHAEPCTVDPCPIYEPAGPYRHVLEVPAGTFERIGAAVGATVRLVAGAG